MIFGGEIYTNSNNLAGLIAFEENGWKGRNRNLCSNHVVGAEVHVQSLNK